MRGGPGIRAIIGALAMLLNVSGCGGLQAPPTPSPLGGTWHVTEVNGVAVDHADAAVIQFTIGGNIVGSSGCHDIEAPYRVDQGTLELGTISPGPAVACPKSSQDAEAAFIAALRQVTTFRDGRPGNQLVLEGAGGTIKLANGT